MRLLYKHSIPRVAVCLLRPLILKRCKELCISFFIAILVHLIAAIVTTGGIIWKQGFRVSSLMCSFFFSADVRRVRFFDRFLEVLCFLDRLMYVSCSIDARAFFWKAYARAFSFVTG